MRHPASPTKDLWLAAAVLLAAGCRGKPEPAGSRDSTRAPADSLAVSAPNGVEVWYTLARSGRSEEGAACTERGLEIRRAGNRVPVPLLYTGETPTMINDTTMRAVLWTNCRAVKPYRVNLRTGQPKPEQERK